MIPDKFNMVDMGGIDLIMMQGEEVPGLYDRLVESITQCRYQCLYNWTFDGVQIPPTYVHMEIDSETGNVKINEGVEITDEDVIHIFSLEPPPLVIEGVTFDENGIYYVPEGIDGYNPVEVAVVSSGGAGFFRINYQVDTICTVSKGSIIFTAPDTSGFWICPIPDTGVWRITITDGENVQYKDIELNYGESLEVDVYYHVDPGYVECEYIEVTAEGPYIYTGITQGADTYFELDLQCISGVNGFFYGSVAGPYTEIEAGSSYYTVYINGGSTSVAHDMSRGVLKAYENKLTFNDVVKKNNLTWSSTGARILLFARSSGPGTGISSKAKGIRFYHVKLWQHNELVRDFYPCKRISDSAPGLFDYINRVFYPNEGTGSIIAGPEV